MIDVDYSIEDKRMSDCAVDGNGVEHEWVDCGIKHPFELVEPMRLRVCWCGAVKWGEDD